MSNVVEGEGGHRRSVAVVIGSGGLKCAASIGLYRSMRRHGIHPDLYVGCSGGSLFAAMMALGLDPESIVETGQQLWDRGVPHKLHYPTLLRALVPRRLLRPSRRVGLLDDRKLLPALAEAVNDATFDQLSTPLHIMTTDLETGERVVITEGSVAEAVRASSAIPLWFRPWEIGGRLLVDGGVADPMPVSVAIREGCDVIIAMGFEQPRIDQTGGLFATIGQVTSHSMNNLLRATFAFYNVAHHAEIVAIVPEFGRRVGLTDTHLLPWLADVGEEAAEAQMQYLLRLLGHVPEAIA